MHAANSQSTAFAPSSSRRSPSRRRRLVESLEGRRLLSTTLNSGVLTLTGGSGVDSFVVTKSGTNVSVVENGGAAKLFAISSVTRINASLNAGNDTINIGNSLAIPASVNGGDGDDGLITGGGNDTIDGGIGNDYIEGRDGQDLVSYSARTDAVTAEIGIDLQWRNGLPPIINTAGAGGVAGENDTYFATESIASGSGNDTLTLTADVWTHYDIEISVPDVGVYGNGGDDQLIVGGVTNGGGNLGVGRQLADGGDGEDQITVNAGSWHPLVTLTGGAGDDYFVGFQAGNAPKVIAGDGIDEFQMYGTLFDDYTMPAGLEKIYVSTLGARLTGNELANTIKVQTFYVTGNPYLDKTIDAGGGDDRITIQGGTASGTVLGGEGDDYFRASADNVLLDGGGGDDQFVLDGNYDNVGPTDQTIVSGSGNDTLSVVDYDAYWNGTATAHLAGPESFDEIYIGDGADLIVDKGATPEANVLRVNKLFIANYREDPAGLLNLNDNPMIACRVGEFFENYSDSPFGYIKAGRDGSAYSGGPGGIESSVVDATPGMAIGYARADELFTSFPATFAGQSVAPTDYIIRTTRAGDINLDRKVDFADLVILAQNYGQTGRTYAQGNVSLSNDGTVDFDDLVILAQNYGSSVAETPAGSVGSDGAASALIDSVVAPAAVKKRSRR